MLWPFAQLFQSPQVTTGHDPVPIFKGAFDISSFVDSTPPAFKFPSAKIATVLNHALGISGMDGLDQYLNMGPLLAWTLRHMSSTIGRPRSLSLNVPDPFRVSRIGDT